MSRRRSEITSYSQSAEGLGEAYRYSAGLKAPSLKFVSVRDALVNTSNKTIYTVPTGKIFVLIGGHLNRISGSAGQIEFKIETADPVTLKFDQKYLNTYGEAVMNTTPPMNEGEKLVLNDASSGSFWVDLYGFEIDASDTGNLVFVRSLNAAAGDTTIFTATEKTFFSKFAPNFSPSLSSYSICSFGDVNSSGSTVYNRLYHVIGGGAKSSEEKVGDWSIGGNAYAARNNYSLMLEAGDTLVLERWSGGTNNPYLFYGWGITFPDP